jgi:phosphoribosylformimino-5-aminoimidazole carboxamide ribotide isomerase
MPGMFEIVPAIDIQGGRCVRLLHGRFDEVTEYADDPVEQAAAWVRLGATRIHVVDLDAARTGEPLNVEIVRRIVADAGVPVQVGGGLRTFEAAARMLELGADRVVLGTALLESPETLAACLEHFPERVVAGIDARDGKVAVRGWAEESRIEALELARRLASVGVVRTIYTDIRRDGALTGPNLDGLRDMVQASGMRVIASGGIGSLEDVFAVRREGAEAVVVGRALYTGDLLLPAALAALEDQEMSRAG